MSYILEEKMKKTYKGFSLSLLSIVMILCLFVPINAESSEVMNANELIEIVNPFIVETFSGYEIDNAEELKNILGDELFLSLENRLVEASDEKRRSLSRDAVLDVHITVLREAGATVDRYWWGTKINTHGRTNAINTRNLATSFSGHAGDAGVIAALTAAGISFIPGLGTAATIAGAIVGVLAWADATTWSTVGTLMTNKIDSYKYYLTIDINKWIMEVKCY